MARKTLFITLIGIIIGTVIGFFPRTENAQASTILVDETIQQQILDSTIQITVFAEEAEQSASGQQYIVGNGLGTLVQDGASIYIVTHDHWSRLVKKLHKAQFHNASGDLLLEVDRSLFYGLIRYRDGGTMVLAAPEQLSAQAPAVPVSKNAPLSTGQTLYVAYWQPESQQQIGVEPVSVEAIETYDGQQAFKMRSQNGKVVIQGNSGGGIFAGSELVGTMWETIVQRQVESGQSTATDMSRAALAQYEIPNDDGVPSVAEQAPTRGEI
jgi:hypothetical protein